MLQDRGKVLESMADGSTLACRVLEKHHHLVAWTCREHARNRLRDQSKRILFAATRACTRVNDDATQAERLGAVQFVAGCGHDGGGAGWWLGDQSGESAGQLRPAERREPRRHPSRHARGGRHRRRATASGSAMSRQARHRAPARSRGHWACVALRRARWRRARSVPPPLPKGSRAAGDT